MKVVTRWANTIVAHRRDSVVAWLLPALLLHAAAALLVVAGLSRLARPPAAAPVPRTRSARPIAIVEILLDDDWPSPPTTGSLTDAAPLTKAHPAATNPAATGAAVTGAAVTGSTPAPLPGREPQPSDEEGAEALQKPPPRLSLDQLGLGQHNPFWSLGPLPSTTPEAHANRRLRAALHQGSLDGDRARGIGPDGPVIEAARRLVFASETLVRSSAVISVRIDATGRATAVEVLDAFNQPDSWHKLAEDLLKALGSLRLRVASGLGIRLRLTAAMRHPGGSDPGLRLDLLGQTLHAGEGPASASISLSPTAPLPRVEAFDRAGAQVDHPLRFEVGLLELRGDATDAATPARRTVAVSVLSVDVGVPP